MNVVEGVSKLINKEIDWNGFLDYLHEDLKTQEWWDEDLLKSLEEPRQVFAG